VTAIYDRSKPEICDLPGRLRWTLLPKERHGDSLSGRESNTQPSNWEATPLSYRHHIFSIFLHYIRVRELLTSHGSSFEPKRANKSSGFAQGATNHKRKAPTCEHCCVCANNWPLAFEKRNAAHDVKVDLVRESFDLWRKPKVYEQVVAEAEKDMFTENTEKRLSGALKTRYATQIWLKLLHFHFQRNGPITNELSSCLKIAVSLERFHLTNNRIWKGSASEEDDL